MEDVILNIVNDVAHKMDLKLVIFFFAKQREWEITFSIEGKSVQPFDDETEDGDIDDVTRAE